MWFGKNLLILLGGCEPVLGNRGRSILMYTSYNISVSFCDAPKCTFDVHSGLDSRMIYCDSVMCQRWIHVHCDLSIKKKKNYQTNITVLCAHIQRNNICYPFISILLLKVSLSCSIQQMCLNKTQTCRAAL